MSETIDAFAASAPRAALFTYASRSVMRCSIDGEALGADVGDCPCRFATPQIASKKQNKTRHSHPAVAGEETLSRSGRDRVIIRVHHKAAGRSTLRPVATPVTQD